MKSRLNEVASAGQALYEAGDREPSSALLYCDQVREGSEKGPCVRSRVSKQRPTNKETAVAPTTMPAIQHVAVTVTDLEASEAWYTKVLGVSPVLDEDTGPFRHIVYPLGGTLLGLHGFPELVSKQPFNERRPGLDHISFGVRDPRRARGVGRPARQARHRPRRHRRRRVRLGAVVPRPRQHRPRALRPARRLTNPASETHTTCGSDAG